MSKSQKNIIITAAIIASFVLLMLFGILSLILKTFAVDVILHTYLRVLLVLVVLKVLQKCFKDQLNVSLNKALTLCGVFVALDLVIVDAVRYILSNGGSTVLFLPICLPLCFIVLMRYSCKDTGKDIKAQKRITYIIGIPLLLLSLYFEILSFVQI